MSTNVGVSVVVDVVILPAYNAHTSTVNFHNRSTLGVMPSYKVAKFSGSVVQVQWSVGRQRGRLLSY